MPSGEWTCGRTGMECADGEPGGLALGRGSRGGIRRRYGERHGSRGEDDALGGADRSRCDVRQDRVFGRSVRRRADGAVRVIGAVGMMVEPASDSREDQEPNDEGPQSRQPVTKIPRRVHGDSDSSEARIQTAGWEWIRRASSPVSAGGCAPKGSGHESHGCLALRGGAPVGGCSPSRGAVIGAASPLHDRAVPTAPRMVRSPQ